MKGKVEAVLRMAKRGNLTKKEWEIVKDDFFAGETNKLIWITYNKITNKERTAHSTWRRLMNLSVPNLPLSLQRGLAISFLSGDRPEEKTEIAFPTGLIRDIDSSILTISWLVVFQRLDSYIFIYFIRADFVQEPMIYLDMTGNRCTRLMKANLPWSRGSSHGVDMHVNYPVCFVEI